MSKTLNFFLYMKTMQERFFSPHVQLNSNLLRLGRKSKGNEKGSGRMRGAQAKRPHHSLFM